MTDPFIIEGPCLWSFSGGRTSAYMLWRALQAYGGTLPADHVVAFANTGKEREETLRFVQECGSRWGVEIVWLEWRDGEPGFERVGFNSASRRGEPLQGLIAKRGFLPNAVTRFCTQEGKVRVLKHFAMRELGWTHWQNIIGLRHDEGHRVLRRLKGNEGGKERWTSVMPLAAAGLTKRDVKTFWLGPSMMFPAIDTPQGFDLGLHDHEGNCDLCFLKSAGKLQRLIADNPGMADWWIEQETSISMAKSKATPAGARFVTEYSYADLVRWAQAQPMLIDDDLLDGDDDSDCDGFTCDDGPGGAPARRLLQRAFERGEAA